MMPDDLKRARLVLTQALVEDPELKRDYVETIGDVLLESWDMREKDTRDEAATAVLDRLFPKSDLDKVGTPLSNPPPAKKPRLLEVGERFYYPKTKQIGHILSISQNPTMPIARVLFEDNRPATLPLRSLVEPP